MNDHRARHRTKDTTADSLTIQIKPVPPFRLDHTVQVLRRHAVNAIDRFDGTTYHRVLVVDGAAVGIEAVQTAPAEQPMLEVKVAATHLPPITRCRTMAALRRLLGIAICLDDFNRMATDDALLRSLTQSHLGLKPPRSLTLFESLVNAIACQQVTVAHGMQLVNRLAAACAARLDLPDGPAFAFPDPEDLADLAVDDLRAIGFSRQKAEAIIDLARTMMAGRLNPNELEALDTAAAATRLGTLHGVGPWTVDPALLRGLGRLSVFPGNDAHARRHVQRWLRLLTPLDRAGIDHALARWRDFKGLIHFHLLLAGPAMVGSASRAFPEESGRAVDDRRRPAPEMLHAGSSP